MNDFQSITSDLITSFNDLVYYDEPHKYFLGGQELISVTTLTHKYKEPFEGDYWSNFKAEQYGVEQYKIQRAWDFINKKGTLKGSLIHDYAENKLLNKVFKYPKEQVITEFGFDPIWVEYKKTKRHVDNFLRASKGKLIPVCTELVMYDKESLIAGMADLIFWNVRDQELQIWDWKTNKSFSKECKERHLTDMFCTLEECDLEEYSLQLEAYKYILEKNTKYKFGKSFLVWVSHNNDDFEIIETKNRKFYINEMVQNRIAELAA